MADTTERTMQEFRCKTGTALSIEPQPVLMLIHTVRFSGDTYETGKKSPGDELAENEYWLGYKVVTMDRESLGLNGHNNKIEYPEGAWKKLDDDEIEEGGGDWGGIWAARTYGGANYIENHMQETHDTETRTYEAALDDLLFHNDYRLKTNRIKLLEER